MSVHEVNVMFVSDAWRFKTNYVTTTNRNKLLKTQCILIVITKSTPFSSIFTRILVPKCTISGPLLLVYE